MANLQLEMLFSDEKLLFQKDHRHLESLLFLLRLEGNCSLLSITSILKALEYHPNSVGYLSQFFHSAGQTLPSTLVIPSKKLVFSLSDEIFAIHAPILEAVWKQSLYKRRLYVICGARLRTDILDNRSLAMLLEISKRLIY